MPDALAVLRDRLAPIQDLRNAANVLEWDAETYLPEHANDARAAQITTLRRLAHAAFTDAATADALAAAEAAAPADPLVTVVRRDVDRATRLPSTLVAGFAEATAHARHAWRHAREARDFAAFAPHLDRIVALNREKAALLGPAAHPYDALLDEFEPGATTADVARVFADLRADLVPLVAALGAAPPLDDACLHRPYPEADQWAFGLDVLRAIGFDLDRGRLDRSAHPFTTAFDPSDVRLTTRLDPDFFPTAFYGTLHEAGHGLYEQGVGAEWARTPLAEGTSLGVHESQSRLWENHVGRGRAFWAHYFPALQNAFPDALAGVSAEAFYAAVNRVEPSLIRVEADEVTYHLHVMLRFELEVALVTGDLAVADVPAAWNDGMGRLLGVRPAHDGEGCLQDVHWSLGTFGYFPTYTLGTLMAAQLWEAAARDLRTLGTDLAAGRFAPLLGWLRHHVHRHGRSKPAAAILQDATGADLSAGPWLAYVRRKYGDLYGVALGGD